MLSSAELGGFLVIQATDGERLIRITTATPLPTPLNALVPLDAIKSILKSKAAFESLEFTGNTVKAQRQTWELIEGVYPPVCDILPPTWEAPAVSGYHNPWFVADAWQAVNMLKRLDKRQPVKMLSEPHNAVKKSSSRAMFSERINGALVQILIMPCTPKD